MASVSDRLEQWRRDAEEIDRQARSTLVALARHIENYPDVKAQTKRILEETRAQAAKLQECLEQDSSPPKDSAGQPSEGCLSGAFIGTENIKRTMAELSGYNVVISSIANATDNSELRAVCEAILKREEAMAEWLKQHVASATAEELVKK